MQIGAKDVKGNAFAAFSVLKIQKTIVDQAVFSLSEFTSLCKIDYLYEAMPVTALTIGNTVARISYKSSIQDKAYIAAYHPVNIIHPTEESLLLLALGSSIHVSISGGPKSWSDYIHSSEVTETPRFNESHVSIKLLEKGVRRTYEITCLKYFETVSLLSLSL